MREIQHLDNRASKLKKSSRLNREKKLRWWWVWQGEVRLNKKKRLSLHIQHQLFTTLQIPFITDSLSIAGPLQCHARAGRAGRHGAAGALGPWADIRPGDPFRWEALKEVQEAKKGGWGSSPAIHCEARGWNSTGAHRCLELVHQGL